MALYLDQQEITFLSLTQLDQRILLLFRLDKVETFLIPTCSIK